MERSPIPHSEGVVVVAARRKGKTHLRTPNVVERGALEKNENEKRKRTCKWASAVQKYDVVL